MTGKLDITPNGEHSDEPTLSEKLAEIRNTIAAIERTVDEALQKLA